MSMLEITSDSEETITDSETEFIQNLKPWHPDENETKYFTTLQGTNEETRCCDICYEDQSVFCYPCPECRKDHCVDCHFQILKENPRCPMCRTEIPVLIC